MLILHDGRQVSRTAIPAAAAETRAHDKVPALTKAMAIVRYLNSAASKGASLNQIAGDLRITKSHCYNILKTLEHGGWLSWDLQRRTYALAPGLLSDVSRLIGRQSPLALIHEELARLSIAADTPCVLTRVDRDGSFVAIDKAEEASELIYSVPIGYRFPPDAPAQMRVRLAWMPESMAKRELARWRPRRYTNTTIVRKKAAWAEIEATRKRGYAISRAEFSLGVMTLAVPIFDSLGEVQMVLQCPGLIDKVRRNQAKIAVELVRTAERLSLIHGGARPASETDSP
jgi:DNA-binding IclR family transcriptional regulator